MGDLIDAAGSILSLAERRVEISAQNIANITTPGYKRVSNFEAALASGKESSVAREASRSAADAVQLVTDFSPGKQARTGNPNDLAVLGNGFFVVQGPDGPEYTRAGQFHRDADGRLLTPEGYPLQSDGGGDIVLKAGAFQVQDDGAVVQAGDTVGRIAIIDFTDRSSAVNVQAGLYSAPEANVTKLDGATVEQGALEASNVSAGAEMVAIMAALRSAQSGARLVTLYDDLMGRAISAFGQS